MHAGFKMSLCMSFKLKAFHGQARPAFTLLRACGISGEGAGHCALTCSFRGQGRAEAAAASAWHLRWEEGADATCPNHAASWHQTACNMSVCQVMAEQGDPVQAPWSGCIYLWQGHAIVRTLHTCSSSIWGCIAVMQQKERFYLRPDDYQRCPSGMAYAAPKG